MTKDIQQADSPKTRTSGWREPASLMLDESGMIRDCSNESEELFGYDLRKMISLHISKLLPQLSDFDLVQNGQLNPRFAYLCHCGHLFMARSQHGGSFLSELSLVSLNQAGRRMFKLFVLPSDAGFSGLAA